MVVVGFDIETDNSEGFGLDPVRSAVTHVCFSDGVGGDVVFSVDVLGSERAVLVACEEFVSSLDVGVVLVSWNGSSFDLPFLAERFRCLGVPCSLVLVPWVGADSKYGVVDGSDVPKLGVWAGLGCVDVCYEWRGFCVVSSVPWSLKPVAEKLGLDPVVVDRERLHELSESQVRDYVVSDARVTAVLASMVRG